MIKRTLFFTNPAYLKTKNKQLVISYPDKDKEVKTIAIEDIGIIVLENQQITLTNGLIANLCKNNTTIITCDDKHIPVCVLQPLTGHSEQTERYQFQLNASIPLKKALWQQTISKKIKNQAILLHLNKIPCHKMYKWAKDVKSGDTENHESRAAVFYWKKLFDIQYFTREQFGIYPNNFLNYGYAVLRAVTARALVSSGMLPSVGIFHKNKYNAFCLADDIMEPYRPFVDKLVFKIINENPNITELHTTIKMQLLQIPVLDVYIDKKRSPLMIAMSRTTNSLFECFKGIHRKIKYPELQ
ncbi:MAG TPA: type II CRISPR-associated endonuclease Cas1 [Flavobacteriia bacterium]|nr:type II CRISPR-associated endonuclease Cas1 [Flavobacteriia bacterium]